MNHSFKRFDCMQRRAFMERCASLAFGVTVLPAFGPLNGAVKEQPEESKSSPGAAASAQQAMPGGFGSAKQIIFLQLRGGMSHIDSFDPKEGKSKGPKGALSTKAGFQVSEFLPKIAKVAEEICVIRSMTAKVGVHEAATYLMRTGYDPRGTIKHPMLGAWAQHYLGASHDSIPSSVCINGNADSGNGFFPATYTPLAILDPSEGLQHSRNSEGIAKVEKRLDISREVDRAFLEKYPDSNVRAYNAFYDATVRLMKSSDLKAFELSSEPQAVRAAYGDSDFGKGCLLARRLVQAGVRFVEVKSGGWDMHNNLEEGMAEGPGAEFDQAYSALILDLKAKGLLESTLVVVATEFGRKPEFAGSGRGHYPKVFSTVLAGAGIRRGYVHEASDALGAEPVGQGVTVGNFHATIGWAAGLPLDKPVIAPNGRPFSIGNRAQPVAAVFA
jgi:hypothetical protein